MKVRIPSPVVRAADAFGDWANVTIWRRGRIELRRIDLLLGAFFFLCVGWYWHTAGWIGAVHGAALYFALTALCLWVF